MAGFLGGSSSSGSGGEIRFPAEFIDPVTKLRVSEPETLIDTDFEYGLQPTKWETVELINNTPSFFSKSGDTTINNITAVTTTQTSREIKVTTASAHGLAVGIPINVSGTKSITADGAYIINSIPDSLTFTYLAKQAQDTTASIFDLYTSIITGEFFQGSQIKISDSQGIVTDAGSTSVLTVQTDSPHGFQVGTPFYFLNLNSTVSQQFDASNTGAKTFDSSNSATAQTFDGSNTLTTYVVDLSNKAVATGTVSTTTGTFSAANKTITVLHSSETFVGVRVGTPLYYNVTAASGYFNTYPRGIVFLYDNGFNSLGASVSTFSVAATPGGTPIDIPSYPAGTFQLATAAQGFAGNNTDSINQTSVTLSEATAVSFDGANNTGSLGTVNTYSGTIIQINNDAGTTVSPALYVNAMVFYTTTGTAATGLTNNTTYWVTYYNEPAGSSVPGFFQIKVAATPGGADLTVSGGTGTQKFRKIGVSTDKDIFHVPFHGYVQGDMIKYTYPAGGKITMTNLVTNYVFIETVYDTYNFSVALNTGIVATGGTITTPGDGYKYHTFSNTNADQTFTVTAGQGNIETFMWGAGGGGQGGSNWGYGGPGGGGGYSSGTVAVTAKTYLVVVGTAGRNGTGSSNNTSAAVAANAVYGGGGPTNGWADAGGPASGGGLTGLFDNNSFTQGNAILIAGGGGGGGASRAGQGNAGGGGGGSNGENGVAPYQGAYYGVGGSQGSGGQTSPAGQQCGAGINGSAFQGGSPGCYGGGGGGGYYGGGAGGYAEPNTMGGGGGGSGYAHPTKVVNAVLTTASASTPANSGSSLRSGAGNGGFSASTAGRLVIRYPG
jgi:urease beta subunit